MKFWVIDICFDQPCGQFMNLNNDSKVMISTKECALQIVKVKIYTKYKQGKNFQCCGSTMVLGK